MASLTVASAPDQTIRLLDYDSDLGGDLRAERREEARNTALARMLVVPRGRWEPPELEGGRACSYGLLVLDGLVTRTVMLGGNDASAQLLGRGDLIRSGDDVEDALVPVMVRWTVLEPLKIALLDERFLLTIRRWPEIVAALFDRVAAQAVRLGTHRAVSQLPRVEDRIHALMWFLAERWGRMTPQGVILPLKLTHELLGQLVGAKRPTVSLAIKELESRGTVHRRGDGAWLLEQQWVREGVPAALAAQLSAGFVSSALAAAEPGPAIGDGQATGNENGGAGQEHGNGHERAIGNGNGAHPLPPLALVPPAAPSFAEIRRRIEWMQERHERSMNEVSSVLTRAVEAQRRAIALRERIARSRSRAAA